MDLVGSFHRSKPKNTGVRILLWTLHIILYTIATSASVAASVGNDFTTGTTETEENKQR